MSTLGRSSSHEYLNNVVNEALPSKGSFIQFHSRLFIALCSFENAVRVARNELNMRYRVVPWIVTKKTSNEEKSPEFVPCSLPEIYEFDANVKTLCRQSHGVKLVYAAGTDVLEQKNLLFLLGCHMIMSHNVKCEETGIFFPEVHAALERTSAACQMQNAWRALLRAKTMEWISFQETFDACDVNDDAIDMEEYMHYASPQNGEIYNIIPGKLLLFRAPDNTLPEGTTWMNKDDSTRLFSAAFYADLFTDMGVSLVMCLDAHDYDAGHFDQRGIATCTLDDLGLSDARTGDLSLQVLDRFMAAMSAVAGPVAIHCDVEAGHACTLIAAYAIRSRYFAAPADAIAWLHMARPGRRIAVQHTFLAQHATRLGRRCRSVSLCTQDLLLPFAAHCPEVRPDGPSPHGAASARAASPEDVGPDGHGPPPPARPDASACDGASAGGGGEAVASCHIAAGDGACAAAGDRTLSALPVGNLKGGGSASTSSGSDLEISGTAAAGMTGPQPGFFRTASVSGGGRLFASSSPHLLREGLLASE